MNADRLSSKIASLLRCVERAREEMHAAQDFATDHTHQDAAVLNALRACEAAIDLANMLIRERRIGIPSDSRDSFSLLQREGIISEYQASSLKRMVGFRNIAVHQYDALDIDITRRVITQGFDDLLAFAECVRSA